MTIGIVRREGFAVEIEWTIRSSFREPLPHSRSRINERCVRIKIWRVCASRPSSKRESYSTLSVTPVVHREGEVGAAEWLCIRDLTYTWRALSLSLSLSLSPLLHPSRLPALFVINFARVRVRLTLKLYAAHRRASVSAEWLQNGRRGYCHWDARRNDSCRDSGGRTTRGMEVAQPESAGEISRR